VFSNYYPFEKRNQYGIHKSVVDFWVCGSASIRVALPQDLHKI